jgi:hypothetical protein
MIDCHKFITIPRKLTLQAMTPNIVARLARYKLFLYWPIASMLKVNN